MRKEIDNLIPLAYDIIKEVGIAIDGKVEKAWRGQISSFGSSIQNGSLLSAVAFYSNDGSAKVNRSKLMEAIYRLINNSKTSQEGKNKLYNFLVDKKNKNKDLRIEKQKVINCAIAIKLALNLYDLQDKTEDNKATSTVQEGGES